MKPTPPPTKPPTANVNVANSSTGHDRATGSAHTRERVVSELLCDTLGGASGLDYKLSHHPRPPAVGITPRRDGVKGLNTPGPGSYQMPVEKSDRVAGFGKKYFPKTKARVAVPGPGSYDPSPVGSRQAATLHFTRGSVKDTTDPPGPGMYTIPSSFDAAAKPSTARTTFGAPLRSVAIRGRSAAFPGPGSYKCPSTFDRVAPKSRAHYITSRFEYEHLPPGPGPGAYDDHYNMLSTNQKKGKGVALKGRLPHALFGSKCAQDVFARMPPNKHRIMAHLRSTAL
eukprot:PhM_4_TR5786/c0_g1_i1/m.76317